jgi:hypothetical protein
MPLPQDIVTNTTTGLVSSLKEVGKIDSLMVKVRAV